jgi:hypothetical protein
VTVRRALTILCLAAIVVFSADARLLQMPFVNRQPFTRALATLPDRLWPEYPRFLEGVRAHTRPGDAIAVVVPSMGWDSGYSYAFYRASYFLAGREVLPLVDRQSKRIPENFRAAQYVAAFGVRLRAPGQVVWAGEGGTLVKLR